MADNDQKSVSSSIYHFGNKRYVRLFKWIEGRIYSSVNPKTDELLFSLGEIAGAVTNSLVGFNHPYAKRKIEWDIAQAIWVKKHVNIFNQTERKLIEYFLKLFQENIDVYNTFRKSVVHNDVNDNNVIVTENLKNPKVKSIIDYGDAVFTQTINDLAICIAYGIMDKADVLTAAIPIIKGFRIIPCFCRSKET